MKIEEVIQQSKPFGSTFEKAMVNLMYTNNWLQTEQKAFFSQFDVTSKQYNILRILRGAEEPISTLEIKKRMLDRNSDVSRIVDRLYKKGLISNKVCTKDQRKIDVCLDSSASALLKKIDVELGVWQNQFSKLSKQEASLLSDLLDKMRK